MPEKQTWNWPTKCPSMELTDIKLTNMKLKDKIYIVWKWIILQCRVQLFLKQRQNTSHNSKMSCIICICIDVEMHRILRKHQPKISYRWEMINRSLLNLGLFSHLKHVLHLPVRQFCVRQFYVRLLHVLPCQFVKIRPPFSCPLNSCLDILTVRHFHVRHFQRPRVDKWPLLAG